MILHVGGGQSRARAEVMAALRAGLAVLVISAVVGALWAVLAPPEHWVVVDPQHRSTLPGESTHRFDAVALFLGCAAATGLLSALAVWRLQRWARGPILVGGLLLGSLLGAGVMVAVGEQVAQWRFPHPVHPAVHTVVNVPPSLDTMSGQLSSYAISIAHAGPALVVQPLLAVLVIVIAAALSTSEDLHTGTGRAHRLLTDGYAPDTHLPPDVRYDAAESSRR